jgi:hypothetical protein
MALARTFDAEIFADVINCTPKNPMPQNQVTRRNIRAPGRQTQPFASDGITFGNTSYSFTFVEGQTCWSHPLRDAFQNHPPAIHPVPVAILERQTLGIDNEAANIARQSVN